MDHRQYIEGSYKIGSVRLSVCLFGSFLGIGSLVFSNFWHGVSNPYEVLLYRAGFFLKKKYFFCPKNGENEPFALYKFFQ